MALLGRSASVAPPMSTCSDRDEIWSAGSLGVGRNSGEFFLEIIQNGARQRQFSL